MKKRNILWLTVSTILILAMTVGSACNRPALKTGIVEVRAMDAPPTGVSSIVVTTSNIEVHKAGASENSWVSLLKGEKTFDLMTIQGAEMFLGQKELEVGQYTQIRLDVTKVKVVLEGKEIIARLPGEKLKVVSPWEVKLGQRTILTIDFDADKFVVVTGKDQVQVKPVIALGVTQGERALKKSTPTPVATVPAVSSTVNANGAKNVPINAKIGAFFGQAMDASTINVSTFTVKQGATPVPGTVTYTGGAATFAPASNLAPNTQYTATISTGAKDLTGQPLANPYIWTWTTGPSPDTSAPMMSFTFPARSQLEVPFNSKISAVFSEVMDPLTLINTFTLRQGTTPVTGAVTYAGVTATFTPAANLAPSTAYTAEITTGAKDLAGNALAVGNVWTFATGAAPDITAPTVSSTIPANNAKDVTGNSAITATFSEPLDPLTVTTVTFTLTQGAVTPVAGVVTYAGVTATFTPDVVLASSNVYTATITTGAKDLAGNAMVGNKEWKFTSASSGGGGGGGPSPSDTTPPTVSSTIPASAATGVAINSAMSAVFSEALDPLTVTTVTFTLKQGVTPVTGAVTYAGVTATFTPTVNLAASTAYTATITTGAKDLAGNALAANKVWSFTTGVAPLATVNLGTAGNYVILAKTAVSTVPASAITGDVGLSPAATTFITGFSLTLVGTLSATSPQVTGTLYGADMTTPTNSNLTVAVLDMQAAYTDAAGRPTPDVLNLGAGEIGGQTLAPGLYKWTTGVTISTNVNLTGGPNDVWILQIPGNLTMSSAKNVFLSGGAQAKNVFWQVAGFVDIGTTAHFEGIILCQTAITLKTGASMNGRALAQTAVILDQNAVTKPTP